MYTSPTRATEHQKLKPLVLLDFSQPSDSAEPSTSCTSAGRVDRVVRAYI